jgi:hypothetical protein
VCNHFPRCPTSTARERLAAHVLAAHPEQGWNLLCNGVVAFDDGGVLLPNGEAISPASRAARPDVASLGSDAPAVKLPARWGPPSRRTAEGPRSEVA